MNIKIECKKCDWVRKTDLKELICLTQGKEIIAYMVPTTYCAKCLSECTTLFESGASNPSMNDAPECCLEAT